jgi:hypothetical protein
LFLAFVFEIAIPCFSFSRLFFYFYLSLLSTGQRFVPEGGEKCPVSFDAFILFLARSAEHQGHDVL